MDEEYIENTYYEVNDIIFSLKRKIRNDTFNVSDLRTSIPTIKWYVKNMIKFSDLGARDSFVKQVKLDLSDLQIELDSVYLIDLSNYLDINKLFTQKSKKKSPNKKCSRNKIVNPKTGRCVLKTGKIGKVLLKK